LCSTQNLTLEIKSLLLLSFTIYYITKNDDHSRVLVEKARIIRHPNSN